MKNLIITGRTIGTKTAAILGLLLFTFPGYAQMAWGPFYSIRSDAVSDNIYDVMPSICPGATPGVINAIWITDYNAVSGGGKIYRARSTDYGRTWSAPVYVTGNDAFVHKVRRGASGTVIAVWHHAGLGDVAIKRSTDDGLNWSANTTIASTTLSYGPSMATNGNGTWVVTHEAHFAGDYDIGFTRSTNDGLSWSADALLHTSFNSDGSRVDATSAVGTDRNGVWVTTWFAQNPTGFPAGFYLMFCRSTDNGATWSTPALVNTQILGTTLPGLAANPGIETDGGGNWIIVTHGNSGAPGSGTDLDIYASRSSDNGLTWSSFQLVNSGGTSDSVVDSYPQLRTDRTGVWMAMWNSDNDTWFSKSTDNGGTWSATRAVNTNHSTSVAGFWDFFIQSDGRWFAAINSYIYADYEPIIVEGIPDLNVVPAPANLGSRIIGTGASAPVTLTLTNDGLATCSLTGSSISGTDASSFSFQTPPSLVTLLPDQSTPCAVTFSPQSTGNLTADAVFTTDYAADPNTTAVLTGIGLPETAAGAKDWKYYK